MSKIEGMKTSGNLKYLETWSKIRRLFGTLDIETHHYTIPVFVFVIL